MEVKKYVLKSFEEYKEIARLELKNFQVNHSELSLWEIEQKISDMSVHSNGLVNRFISRKKDLTKHYIYKIFKTIREVDGTDIVLEMAGGALESAKYIVDSIKEFKELTRQIFLTFLLQNLNWSFQDCDSRFKFASGTSKNIFENKPVKSKYHAKFLGYLKHKNIRIRIDIRYRGTT